MKYLSLLMLVVCISAFANASNSVPVEKGKEEKLTGNNRRSLPPTFVRGANQTIYTCGMTTVNLTPLLTVTDPDGNPDDDGTNPNPDAVAWGVTNEVDITAAGKGTLSGITGTSWHTQDWVSGEITPTDVTMLFTPAPGATGSQDIVVQCTDGGAASYTTITVIFGGSSPFFNDYPDNTTVCAGGAATFTLSALGFPAPTYQWQVLTGTSGGYIDMPGEEGTTLSFTTDISQNGSIYRLKATNACGFYTSDQATLTVLSAPTTVPVFSGDALIKSGGTGTYNAVFYNGGTYAWSFSEPGAAFSGNTQIVTANFAGVSADGNVTLQYDNGCGLSPASAPLPVHFVAPPAAVDDNFTALEGAANITGNVLAANPTTPDTYDPLASPVLQVVSGPSEPGTLNLQNDGTFTYTPDNADFNGIVTFTYNISDAVNTPSAAATVTINIAAVNDAPVIATPPSFSLDEDNTLTLSGVSFSDTDMDPLLNQPAQASITVTDDNISLAAAPSGAIVVAQTGNDIILTGTIVNINAYIAAGNLVYTPAVDYNGTFDLVFWVSDFGNTGAPGTLTATATATVTIAAVNDAPIVAVPTGTRDVLQTGSLTYDAANLVSINDIDAGAGALQLAINPTGGTVTLSGTTGLSFSSGDGTADASLVFTGSLTDINNALNGLAYTPTSTYSGPGMVGFSLNDLGHTGSGGVLNASGTAYINVLSVPRILSVNTGNPDNTYKIGDAIGITLTLSEAVTVSGGTPSLTLETGSTDQAASYSGGSGTTLNFTYTVQAGDASADLDVTGVSALSLNGATIENGAGTALNITLPAPGGTGSLSAGHQIVIDGIAPAAPVTVTPANGSITNNNIPTYTGTAEPNSTVTLYVDGTAVGGPTANASGNWTFTPAVPLADGNHITHATATDAAGNTGPDGNTNAFTVDVTSPAAPVTSAPANGSATNDNTPEYAGTAEPGSTVTVVVDGIPVGTTPADASGNWTLTPPAALADGSHTVYARTTDVAGNTGPDGNTNIFTVDVTAPASPVITSPANGSTTNDNTPAYAGNAEPNSTVTVIVDGLSAGTATTNASGNWSFTAVAPLADGSHTVYATATDAVNNTSPAGSTHTFTVDVVAPGLTISTAAPSKVNAAFTVTMIFSEAVLNFVTSDISVTNATVSGLATSDGITYTALITPAVDGAVNVQVNAGIANDAAGNDNTASNALALTYDATPPSVTISSPAPANVNAAFTATIAFSEDITGFDIGDITAVNATLSSFTALNAQTYTVLVTPAADGIVTLDIAAAVAQDAAGNDNTAATQLSRNYDATAPTVTVTIAAPVAPAAYIATFTFSEPVTGFNLADLSLTSASATNFTVVNASTYTAEIVPAACTFTVTAIAAAAQDAAGNTSAVSNTASTTQSAPVIAISSDKPAKVVAGEAVVLTASGAVTYQWTAAHGIVSGDNTATLHIAATQTTTYTVTGTNQWGCAGTATYTQEIDATPAAPAITVPVNGSALATLSPAISGTAEAGATITVYIDGSAQGTAPADGTGNWSFAAPALAPGAHTAFATATTPLGTTGPQGATVNFTIDNGLPGVTVTATTPDASTGIFTATFTFTEPVMDFTASDITMNGATLSAFTTVSATEYTVQVTPVACTVTLQVIAGRATDMAGNANTASNTSSTTLPNPVVAITSNKPAKVVANEEVTLQASGAVTYQWASAPGITGSLTSAQLTIQPAATTTYTVTGTSQFGCTAVATYLQEVDVAPAVPVIATPAEGTVISNVRPVISGTADAGSTVTIYLNGIVQNTLPVSGTGDWSFTPSTDLAEGAYAATATASTPLGTASASSAATNFTIDITSPTVTLTVSTANAVSGEYTGTFTFSEPVTGFTAGDVTVSGGSVTAFAAVSTSVYTATITPTTCTSTLQTASGAAADAAGNTSSASNTGSVTQQTPAVTITSNKPAMVEENETVILTASGAASYQWANASGIVSGQATAALTIEPTENTAYTVTGTSQFGCTATAQYTQQVNIIPGAPVIVAPANNTVTNNPRPAISGTSEANTTVTVYADNNSIGTATADAAGAWSFTPAADLADGAHMLTAIATNAQHNASPESATVNIGIDRVQPAVTAIATAPDAVTGVFEVTFTFSEPVTGFTAGDITHPQSTLNTFTAVSATEYRISLKPTECATDVSVNANVAIDQAGNGNTSGNPVQVVQQNPEIAVTAEGNGQVSLGETIRLRATGGAHYVWEPADGIVSGMNTPDLIVRPPSNYTYRVAGYNQWGCMTQAEISVTVVADYKVDATNVITPNGDGINDRWVVRNINSYPDNFLRIFDRGGQLVYQKRNYANEWDGTTASGRPLAEGAYLYVLEIDNGKKVVKGYITLIREKR